MKITVLPVLVLSVALGGPTAASAAPADPAPAPAAPKTEVERQRIIMERVGGFVERERQGTIALLNAQTAYDTTTLKAAVAALAESLKTPISCFDGAAFRLADAEKIRQQAKVDQAIFLVDDPVLPITLCAPEARWALVNLASLKADSPNAEKLDKRVVKSFVRAFVTLNGGAMTKFTTSVLRPVSSVKDLDRIIYRAFRLTRSSRARSTYPRRASPRRAA